MQINKIVLYSKHNQKRVIDFNIGQLNIISGKSKTGKSVIGDIIDYCFGGQSCNIAIGVVRDTVAWYGLLLEHNGEKLFVARQNPPNGQASTGNCCYQFACSDIPETIVGLATVDCAGLEKLLSKKIGISENVFNPPQGSARRALSANIRHAMFYCIQGQDEIAAQKLLFHKQSEQFMAQAIKDTLPYFLGILDEQNLELENERNVLKREALLIGRKLEELAQLKGNGLERAISLIEEAKLVGLIHKDATIDKSNDANLKQILREACQWKSVEIDFEGMDRISYLQAQIEKDQRDLENVKIKISNAQEYVEEGTGYSIEAKHQINRLNSIGLFEELNLTGDRCPFCSAELEHSVSYISDIRGAVEKLSQNLALANREKVYINPYIKQLKQEKQQIEDRIKLAQIEINAIYENNQEAIAFKDLNSRRARVVGRISLWLESVVIIDDSKPYQEKLNKINSRLTEINSLLDGDVVEERKQSIINRLSVEMSKWAKELKLEHCDYPYRLDMNRVTVVVDRDRPVPLSQLGSGSNWLGCHLIALFALHKYFINNNRPVPHVLFIDQPSQVYFPPETGDENVDSEEIRTIYKFIYKFVQELSPNMQIIVVDHADIQEDYFQDSVIEKWWDKGDGLIPLDWINS